jgi:vitamin B12 transporter
MRNVHRVRAAALPVALAAAFPLHAQTVANLPTQLAQAPALREMVITATRVETRADELVSDVTVIDRTEIESSTARTLPELLARVAGLQMVSNGGRGKNSNVFIRGTETRHTILLVDGVRVGSATAGQPSWELLPVELIDRIEVVKGPASALYGSDGVGGVVQIFTLRGREGFHPSAATTVGSYGHAAASVGVSAGQGPLTYAFGVQRVVERGFSATLPHYAFGYNPDVDPFRLNTVVGSVGYTFNKDWRAEASVLYSDGINHFDDGLGVDSQAAVRNFVGHASVKGRVMTGWQTELSFGQGNDTNDNIYAVNPAAFQTRQSQWTWQNNIDTPIGVAVAGLERREQKVQASVVYDVTQRSIDGVFAGLNGNAGAHSWQINLRRDRNSQFGSADTGFAGYGYRITPNWRAQASYGTSFVAPSFNQLYYPRFGNPLLQPEHGRNADIGVTYTRGDHEVKLTHFDNRIRGFITGTTIAANVPRARIDGWSLAYDGKFGNWGLKADLETLDPRNQLTGKQLPRRAKQQLSLGADYTWGAWTFGGWALHEGDRFDDTANAVRLPAYTTLDLYADWRVAKDWTLQAKVNNVTDRHYETAYGYNQPGRAFYLTLRWQPK